MKSQSHIAVDLGDESGRVMLAVVSQDIFVLEEIHRFTNGPVHIGESLRWDFSKLLAEIKNGIKKAVQQAISEVVCVCVDSWGGDFGLLDEKGRLLENSYHYRDNQTDGVMDKAYDILGKRAIYDQTGSTIDCLHIVGGGVQNELLCQFAANATGKKIIAGRIESIRQIRQIVRNSFDIKEYLPEEISVWQSQSDKYRPRSTGKYHGT